MVIHFYSIFYYFRLFLIILSNTRGNFAAMWFDNKLILLLINTYMAVDEIKTGKLKFRIMFKRGDYS